MKTQEFLGRLPEVVRSRLPAELQGFTARRPFGGLIKLHYGPSWYVHYEVWIQPRPSRASGQGLGIVEVGLHFEADPETNARCLAWLSQHFEVIRRALGEKAEPEQWTSSWTRLHESVPLAPLDEAFLELVADRLARYMATLEPLLAGMASAGGN